MSISIQKSSIWSEGKKIVMEIGEKYHQDYVNARASNENLQSIVQSMRKDVQTAGYCSNKSICHISYLVMKGLEEELLIDGKEGPTHLKDYVVDVLEKKHKVLQQIVSKESTESKAALEKIEKKLYEMSATLEVHKQTTDNVQKVEIPEFNRKLIDIDEKIENLVKENSDLSKKNSRLCLATTTMVCVCASTALYFIGLALSAQEDSGDPEELSFLSFFKC